MRPCNGIKFHCAMAHTYDRTTNGEEYANQIFRENIRPTECGVATEME